MNYTRREFGKITLAALPSLTAVNLLAAAKPNSVFGGVRIGVITYSFRALPGSAEEVLRYCVDCGFSGIELMSDVAESFAGSPALAGRGAVAAPGGGGGGRGRGRAPLTPEEQEARRKRTEDLKNWRLSVPMEKYKAFRRMYEDAGVKIYAFKLPPTLEMSDGEYEYIWNVGETLGADHITMELPSDDALLKRVADYAAKRKLRIAFHTHGQGGASEFDKVLAASPYTALNLDVGHFYGVTGESPVPVIEKYHDRIASLHLKDRKGPEPAPAGGQSRGGAMMPWGQGGTPLTEVLKLMKKNKYKFPASVEFEYSTPEGSDVLTEVKKCLEYCKRALA
jgi:sugar phosphate isomerase/epimerase